MSISRFCFSAWYSTENIGLLTVENGLLSSTGTKCSVLCAIFSSLLRFIYHGLRILCSFLHSLKLTIQAQCWRYTQTRDTQVHSALEINYAFLYRLSLASDLANVIDILTGSHDLTPSFHFFSLNIQPVCHRIQKRNENTDNKLHDARTHNATHADHISNVRNIYTYLSNDHIRANHPIMIFRIYNGCIII